MSDQVYADDDSPLWLSSQGCDKIQFNKNTNPPLGLLNKGILYEMDDGKLYYNGNELGSSPVPVGNISGPEETTDNALVIWDGTSGEVLKNTNVILEEGLNSQASLKFTSGKNLINNFNDNLLVGNDGELGDENTIRIGENKDKCFISGIYDKTSAGADKSLIINSQGQIGTGPLPIPVSGESKLNSIVRFDSTDGSQIKDSSVIFEEIPETISTWANISQNVKRSNLITNVLAVNPNRENIYSGSSVSLNIQQNSVNNFRNVFIGGNIGEDMILNNTNRDNVFIGSRAGGNQGSSNYDNVAIGTQSLRSVSTGNRNVCLGRQAGFSISTGERNTIIGNTAMGSLTTGSDNIIIGNNAGFMLTANRSNNILIGNSGDSSDPDDIIKIGKNTGNGFYIPQLSGTESIVDNDTQYRLAGINQFGRIAPISVQIPISPDIYEVFTSTISFTARNSSNQIVSLNGQDNVPYTIVKFARMASIQLHGGPTPLTVNTITYFLSTTSFPTRFRPIAARFVYGMARLGTGVISTIIPEPGVLTLTPDATLRVARTMNTTLTFQQNVIPWDHGNASWIIADDAV